MYHIILINNNILLHNSGDLIAGAIGGWLAFFVVLIALIIMVTILSVALYCAWKRKRNTRSSTDVQLVGLTIII
jgi:membrane protein implicated in regulation of membrane protease activity